MGSQTLRPPITDLVPVVVYPAWSLEKGLLTGGAAIKPGTVLAKVAGKYQVINFAGTAADKKAAAVAYEMADVESGDIEAMVVARGAVVDVGGLIWPEGATDTQKSTAAADLDARGIVLRAAL